jgi:hypothetical protein
MTTENKELMTRAAYANYRGVAPRTIGKYVQREIIPLHGNKIDPDEADKCLADHLPLGLGSGKQNLEPEQEVYDTAVYDMWPDEPEPVKSKCVKRFDERMEKVEKLPKPQEKAQKTGKKSDKVTKNETYSEVRIKEKQLKVELLELDLQLKRGQMVLTKDVEFAAFTQARKIRDKMLNIPDRISALLAAESDELKVREILVKDIELELSATE